MNSVIEKHLEEYSQEPSLIVEVPGVSVLFGEFADYCKGYSICAANDLKLSIGISKREDSLVKMCNTFSGDHKRFSLSGIKYRKEDRWGNFVKGLVLSLQNSNAQLSGMNITFTGTLLASDTETVASAIGIGVAIGLNKMFNLGMDSSQIVRHVFQSSTGFCQEGCKYMTLITMLEAQENNLLLFDNQQVTNRSIEFVNGSPDYRFCMIESRIPPLAMREELTFKAGAMKRAFEILKRNYPNVNLRDVPESELSERVIQIDEESRQICSYILDESKTAREAFRCFESGDSQAIGKLLNKVQKGLRDKLDLTCPEVDWLVKRANEITGCFGACMIPTGLSGSILVIMNSNALDSYKERLTDYEHIFGFSARLKDFHCQGCATVVRSL